MATAQARFKRDRLAKSLNDQLDAWELAGRIRAFCEAAKRAGRADGEWLAWALDYADDVDPTTDNLTLPEPDEPDAEGLRPYLGGWSPYGPDRR